MRLIRSILGTKRAQFRAQDIEPTMHDHSSTGMCPLADLGADAVFPGEKLSAVDSLCPGQRAGQQGAGENPEPDKGSHVGHAEKIFDSCR